MANSPDRKKLKTMIVVFVVIGSFLFLTGGALFCYTIKVYQRNVVELGEDISGDSYMATRSRNYYKSDITGGFVMAFIGGTFLYFSGKNIQLLRRDK